jgi:hypothetical protein
VESLSSVFISSWFICETDLIGHIVISWNSVFVFLCIIQGSHTFLFFSFPIRINTMSSRYFALKLHLSVFSLFISINMKKFSLCIVPRSTIYLFIIAILKFAIYLSTHLLKFEFMFNTKVMSLLKLLHVVLISDSVF